MKKRLVIDMKCLVPKPLSKKDKKELNELVYKFVFKKFNLINSNEAKKPK